MQPRAYRTDRHLEHVRDLVIREVLHEVERAHHAVFFRQLTDRFRHALRSKPIDERSRRILALPRQAVLSRARVEIEVGCIIEVDGVRTTLTPSVIRPEAAGENAE